MSGKLERILLRSPSPIRTLASNLKAWQLEQQRRGKGYNEILEEYRLERYFQMSSTEIHDEQNKLFSKLLALARTNVPYYRKAFERLPEITSTEQIHELPFLTKEIARGEARNLLSDLEIKQPHYIGHTSGSTGTPFTFYLSLDSLKIRTALRDNFVRLHGFTPGQDRDLRLGGRLFMDVSIQTPPFWIINHVRNRLMFSLYHMNDENMHHFIQPLEKYKPVCVTGYPSAAYTLARFCLEQRVNFRPSIIFTDSETVLDYQKDMIHQAWECEIKDYYGMEAGWIAGQWEGKYHLSPLTSIIEIIDDNGNPQKPGEAGEIVVTDLTNHLMPFIRYRTGDVGIWATENTDQKWKTRTLQRIEGRIDDIVILPDGRKIGRLDHIFKSAQNIRECQIVQETVTDFRFLIVPDRNFTDDDKAAIEYEARLRLGNQVNIHMQFVDSIAKSKKQKFRSVISHLNPSDLKGSIK